MRRAALITGASGGIGAALARAFAPEFDLALHYRSNRAAAQALKRELEGAGAHCALLKADLSRPQAPAALVRGCLRALGRLDVLLNNAGANSGGADFRTMTAAQWDENLALNARAPFFLAREAFAAMKDGGRIVNISSVAAKFGGSARSLHYAAAKAAVEAMTLGLARQGAERGILVNAIRPGVIDTPFHEKFRKNMSERVKLIPLGRAGKPEEVARLALFLAGKGGSFITGQVLGVTGGE
ncbi:MAG: SDR family oxidoreductase [Elusimicrobia bacterium]|nr:SDR family oxidoreductase [Elusimicrobiota bacterium]MDE2426930.1 SDR family oxidoreductase [Elusimicrobiota bacterium]